MALVSLRCGTVALTLNVILAGPESSSPGTPSGLGPPPGRWWTNPGSHGSPQRGPRRRWQRGLWQPSGPGTRCDGLWCRTAPADGVL